MLGKSENKNLKTTKVIRLLSKLAPKTVKQFKAWHKLQGSPKRDAFLVLAYLLLHYPTFEMSSLQQGFAFKKIFGKIPYDYRRLMKAMSQVHLDLKRYLIQLELVEDDFLNDFLLARIYTKYQLRHELTLLLDKKRAVKPTISSPQYYYEQMQWEQLDFFGDGKTKLNSKENNLNKAMTALDLYYLGDKLKYACDIATRQVLLGTDYVVQFSETLQTFCQDNFIKLPVFHRFYYLAWRLIINREAEVYWQLKQLFGKRHPLLEKEDQLILFTYLFNFTAFKIRTNTASFIREAFELFKFSIEKDLLIVDQLFVEEHFISLVNISCALKEFDWLENTLQNQLVTIIDHLSPSVYALGLARIAFAKKNFLKCREYLINVDYNLFNYSKRARSFQLMCAYELDEPPLNIEASCKSFENYLRRNKSKRVEDLLSHLNFISFIRHFIKIAPNKQKLLEDIDAKPTIFKLWVLEKIKALK